MLYFYYYFQMDSNNDLIIIQQDRKFSVSPTSVESGWSLTVNWFMPVDEASSKDWIGLIQNLKLFFII